MPLSACPRCEKVFNKGKGESVVCPECLPSENEDYENVREYLQSNPTVSAESLAEEVGIELTCILRFLEDGRIETTAANKSVMCGRCGAPAISLSKRLCESCLQRLNSEINLQQSKIELGTKKRVEVGTDLAKRDKSAAIKFQR